MSVVGLPDRSFVRSFVRSCVRACVRAALGGARLLDFLFLLDTYVSAAMEIKDYKTKNLSFWAL